MTFIPILLLLLLSWSWHRTSAFKSSWNHHHHHHHHHLIQRNNNDCTRLFQYYNSQQQQQQQQQWNPYAILNIPYGVTDQSVIKRAYKKAAKHYHPDRNRDPNAADRFIEINNAYEILSNPNKYNNNNNNNNDHDRNGRNHNAGQESSPKRTSYSSSVTRNRNHYNSNNNNNNNNNGSFRPNFSQSVSGGINTSNTWSGTAWNGNDRPVRRRAPPGFTDVQQHPSSNIQEPQQPPMNGRYNEYYPPTEPPSMQVPRQWPNRSSQGSNHRWRQPSNFGEESVVDQSYRKDFNGMRGDRNNPYQVPFTDPLSRSTPDSAKQTTSNASRRQKQFDDDDDMPPSPPPVPPPMTRRKMPISSKDVAYRPARPLASSSSTDIGAKSVTPSPFAPRSANVYSYSYPKRTSQSNSSSDKGKLDEIMLFLKDNPDLRELLSKGSQNEIENEKKEAEKVRIELEAKYDKMRIDMEQTKQQLEEMRDKKESSPQTHMSLEAPEKDKELEESLKASYQRQQVVLGNLEKLWRRVDLMQGRLDDFKFTEDMALKKRQTKKRFVYQFFKALFSFVFKSKFMKAIFSVVFRKETIIISVSFFFGVFSRRNFSFM